MAVGLWQKLLGTMSNSFKIGKGKATLDASGLTAARTHTLPDRAGTLALTGTGTANTLAKYTDAGTVGNTTITDDGTTLTPTKSLGYTYNGPPTLGTVVNDYSPGDGVYFSLIAATGGSTITGFANPTNGRVLIIENAGTDTITLSPSNSSSSVNNRILCKTSGASAIVLSTNDCATLIYSGRLSKWMVVCPTLPQIHNHQSNAQGGKLDAAAIATGQLALASGGTNADLSATGGAHNFLKQSSSGAAVTVGTIGAADLAAEAWTTFTPTITAQTGTPTTVSATGRYIQYGKLVICQMDVSITTVGTATTGVKATLPVTAAANVYAGSCYEYNTTGKSGAAVIIASDSTHLFTRDATGATWWINGYKLAITIVYEAA